jgi:hypothetical protein
VSPTAVVPVTTGATVFAGAPGAGAVGVTELEVADADPTELVAVTVQVIAWPSSAT